MLIRKLDELRESPKLWYLE